jgi:hypothetical protein
MTSRPGSVTSRSLAFATALALAPAALAAQTVPERPSRAAAPAEHSVTIQRATGAIRVDGALDDPGWEGAARVSGFTEFAPREGARPPAETEVLLTYDDQHLYVGFIAHGDPAAIRASWRNRDQIWNDDVVGILIDPYGDASLGYLLVANPHGIPGDILMSPRGEDDSWDAIFESRGRITETGYVVEMAIPFRSLRFPDRTVQEWRVNFYRNIPRDSRHQLTWAPLSQNNACMLCQNGALHGLEGVRPGGGLELLPAVVASQAGRLGDPGDPGSFENADVSAQVSLGAKYAFANGWTLEGTYNPDFSQVESDAAQIDVNTTFALFYPERRPFFQEGSDLYSTWVNVFYSRSINAPQFATKLTGRAGRTSVGFVGARDERTPYIVPLEDRSSFVQAGPSVSNALRVRHNVYEGSHIGAMLTDRRLEQGGSGTSLSVDALLRFRRVYQLQLQLVGSHTVEPDDTAMTPGLADRRFGRGPNRYTAAFDGERFSGHAAHVGLIRSARVWNYELFFAEASPTYRADNGYQPRNDFRRTNAWTGVNFRPRRYGVEQVLPGIGGGAIWNLDGERKDVWLRPGVYMLLPRQTNVSVNAVFSRELFRGIEFPDIRRYAASVSTTPSAAVQAGFYVERGRSIARTLQTPEMGSGLEANLWANLRPVARLTLSPSVGYGHLRSLADDREFYAGYIARVRGEYQFNRELSLRVVTQYNDFSGGVDVEPLLVYRLNPFSIFYVGSTQGYGEFDPQGWRPTGRQYFLKFQYLFQM